MAIAFDATGTPVKQTAAATSATVDITAAATGAWVYFGGGLGTNQTGVTFTGWTQVLEADESTATHYFVFRRLKQSGDTTFTVSWPTSTRLVGNWTSFTGQDGTTPDELAAATLHTTGTSFPTPSLTPNGTGRWAWTFTYARDTTAEADLPDGSSWTPDAALTERTDASNFNAVTSPWLAVELADSNGTVTQAAHSYTATCVHAETHGAAILLFLVPAAAAGVSGTVQPRATVPVPRRTPARAVWARRAGQQAAPVPAPAQQFRAAPRRVPARAFVQFIPVRTVNATPPAPVSGTMQPRATVPVPRRPPGRGQWRGAAVPGVTGVAPRQQYQLLPRRAPARAFIRFIPVPGVNAVPAGAGRPAPAVDMESRLIRRYRRMLHRHGLAAEWEPEVSMLAAPVAFEVPPGWPGTWPAALTEPEPELPAPALAPAPPAPRWQPVYTRPPKIVRARHVPRNAMMPVWRRE